MKAVLVALNAKYVQSNLAVYALRTSCRNQGIECEIYQSNVNESIEAHLYEIVRKKPDVVGFSCYIWNIAVVAKLMEDLKKLMPDLIIVLGGPEVSEAPEEALEKYKPDYVVQGPGEAAWPELLFSIKQGIPPGERVLSRPVSIAETPFPYLDEDDLENHLVYYEASRGCQNRCAYCLSSVNRKLEFRPLELVFADIKKLWDKGVRQVKFVDRTFNLHRERTLALWKHLLENYPTGNFHFEIAADRISEEELAFLKTVPPGLFQMEIGVQSTYPPTLEAIRRKTDTEKLLERIAQLSQDTDVLVYADLIAGLPHESYERFLQSFKDVMRARPNRLHLGFLKLLPGTYLREHAHDLGIVYSQYPPYEVLKTKDISFLELNELKGLDYVVDRYYNSDLFQETFRAVPDAGEFLLCLTARLKATGHLFTRMKLESFYQILYKEFPELGDFVLLDFLKQGLSRQLPSWYRGDVEVAADIERPKELPEKNPVVFLHLSDDLRRVFGAETVALVMGMPHIDRRCQEIVKIG